MPPPFNHTALHLQVLSKRFFVLRLQPEVHLPPCVLRTLTNPGTTGFLSITRTKEEISLVGESHEWLPDSLKPYSDWRCIKIMGPMEHDLIGVMAALTTALKEARIPVFAISTWNTDYVLIPLDMLSDAIKALDDDKWTFVEHESISNFQCV